MKRYSRGYAAVHLDGVEQNMKAMLGNLQAGTGIMGVVKADGYGHGSVPVARAIDPYVCGFAVATMEEAMILKSHGLLKPVLILGPVHEACFGEAVENDVRLTVFQYEKAKKLSRLASELGKTARIHLALDTGMGRIGLEPVSASLEVVKRIAGLSALKIEGIFTHFSKADEKERETTIRQLKGYGNFVERLENMGIRIPVKHCANSAAIIGHPEAGFNMVRAGISTYGLYPSSEVDKTVLSLTPVLEWFSFVTYVKKIAPGTAVSYGGTFLAEREMTIATISVGYGDGYPRNLSNCGDVLIRGRRARILGRVCMDQLMVDVSEIPETAEGDKVTLIGCSQEETITVEELADLSGGFHYEILCNIGKRVPRVYYRGGDVVGTKDYFDDQYHEFSGL